MKYYFKTVFIVFLLISILLIRLSAEETINDKKKSPAKISTEIRWGVVTGVKGYFIEIADFNGNIIVKDSSIVPRLGISVYEGRYKIRIGSINKFGKVQSWSDWADLKVSREQIAVVKGGKVIDKTGEIELVYKDHKQFGIKFGLGSGFFHILSDWGDVFYNSYSGAFINIGYDLKSISSMNSNFFFKRLGFEIESMYYVFENRKYSNRIDSRLTNIINGFNLSFSSGFDSLFNVRLKSGIGFSRAVLNYDIFDTAGVFQRTGVAKTDDFYFKTGTSLYFNIDSYFYSEIGVDFYNILYENSSMKSFKYYFLIGFIL